MKNKIIDTHTHLYDKIFDMRRDEVLSAAADIGVTSILTVGETLDDAAKILELSRQYQMIRPLAGLYPSYLDPDEADRVIAFIRANRKHLIGIGEVGLDYWVIKDEEQKEIQREIFRKFISLSLELDLPLNVHSRSAGKYAIEVLQTEGAQKVQLHAFDGKAGTALKAVESGYLFSIPPSIIRSRQKQKLVKALPLSCLLLETDSPVLGPNHQEVNEPKNIVIALEAVAEIKGFSREAVGEAAYENTIKLYRI